MSNFLGVAIDCWMFLITVAVFVACGGVMVSLIKKEYRRLKSGYYSVESFARRLIIILIIMLYGIYALILIDYAISLWDAIF